MSEENKEYTFENPEYRKTYWHTCSHIDLVRIIGNIIYSSFYAINLNCLYCIIQRTK